MCVCSWGRFLVGGCWLLLCFWFCGMVSFPFVFGIVLLGVFAFSACGFFCGVFFGFVFCGVVLPCLLVYSFVRFGTASGYFSSSFSSVINFVPLPFVCSPLNMGC